MGHRLTDAFLIALATLAVIAFILAVNIVVKLVWVAFF
jgi:hypothetical protein